MTGVRVIAGYALREAVRRRVFLVVLFLTALFLTLYGLANYYVFREIMCDIGGRAFELHRLGLGNLYHVRVGTTKQCSCECLGFLAHGKCKHVLGLLALTGHELV